MILGLSIAVGVLFISSVVLAALFFSTKLKKAHLQGEIARFKGITDVEQHLREQKSKADAAIAELARATSELQELASRTSAQRELVAAGEQQLAAKRSEISLAEQLLGAFKTLDEVTGQIEKQKRIAEQYNQVIGNFKTAEELRVHIAQQKARIQELSQTIGKFESIPALDNQIAALQSKYSALQARCRELQEVLNGADTPLALQKRIKDQEAIVASLLGKTQQLEEASEMQEFGFYQPHFDFDSSSKYQQMLETICDQQKAMVKDATAVKWEKTWMVEGSDAKGRKMMQEQTKLMLRAFNGECDAAVARVKYNNATTLESRITRAFEQINKLGKTNCAMITESFFNLKLKELYLVHEHRVKQQEEREEQQRIREQMKDEEKARREIEDAQEKAAREEEIATNALERARRAFERATDGQRAINEETKAQNSALAIQVAKLESELKEAIDRKAKAIARSQLTRSGYIYVLSNVGSFGEEIYKLGMTRRLDPLERVKELGDASVPFPFDVHAVIYSEDAPALECRLHQHFAERRLNLVNLRREYFKVTLEEIIAAVGEFFGEITFVKFPEAAEFRETIAKRKTLSAPDAACVVAPV